MARPTLCNGWLGALLLTVCGAGAPAAIPGPVQDSSRETPKETPTANPACHGTAVEFLASPREAAAAARKQGKLVMILHVSGHFEDPGFT